MKNRCVGLVIILVSLCVFGVAYADIEFAGVLDASVTLTIIDSVTMRSPDTTFLTSGWDSYSQRVDTFTFTGVTAWPETIRLHGTVNSFPFSARIVHPKPDSWYYLTMGLPEPKVMFCGDYGGAEESKPLVALPPRLAVSPSVVTGQMTVRLSPAGISGPVVAIHDAAGNLVRSLDCTAGTDGVATATWDREDEYGQVVPEGVYFCRYAASDVIAVRKILAAR